MKMIKNKEEFRSISMPYCLKLQPDGTIYLYDDGSIPTRNKRNMRAYLEKLVIL